jgi:prepilin-type processing-associated H-X9-DG protein
MTWGNENSNTNLSLFQTGLLTPYISGNAKVLKCPADKFLSPRQVAAGWSERLRSYSLNAFVGRGAGGTFGNAFGKEGMEKLSQIKNLSYTLLMAEVHPDSIYMCWYLVSADENYNQWWWLPASHHNRGAAFSFTDGHAELHRWRHGTTVRPVTYAQLYTAPNSGGKVDQDFVWVVRKAIGKQ